MTLKEYPSFIPLELGLKPVFDEAFRKNPPSVSEFTFTNLYAWRKAYGFDVSLLDNSMIVRSSAGGQPRFLPPIGSPDIYKTVKKIMDESGASFMRVPGSAKPLFENDARLSIVHDRDNSDYIFKTADLAELKGSKYDGKRNLIKKFESEYEYEFIKLDGSNAGTCLTFEEEWCVTKECDRVIGLNNERNALKEIVANFSAFDLKGSAIRINGAIKAIALGEGLDQNTFVIHILKADQSLAGLYQKICRDFIRAECGGYEYINMEQDLGVPGLRKSKSSYHPAGMIDKYTIGPKGGSASS